MSIGQSLRDHRRELATFESRLAVAGLVIFAAFALLTARFVWLQVIQKSHYHTLAEANRISIVPAVPNRGVILDRHGEVLASNESAYTLEVTPTEAGNLERALEELAQIIDITPRDRRRLKRLQEETRNLGSLPVRTRLSEVEVARFAANRYRFPGFDVKARLFRSYPQGEVASHAVGYIGRINEADLKRIEAEGQAADYKGTLHIGKLGIEGAYEQDLHGTTGSERVETDAGGRAIRSLSREAPLPGNDLIVTLDLGLQRAAEEAFGDYRGALVAIEPKTGDVLALVSKPGFDPNLFVDGIDPQSWDQLNNSPDKPLNNRALRGQYPPGSTIKPFMALAALSAGKRTPEFTIADPGVWSLPGVDRPFRDWKQGGHGMVNLHRSIVISCDTYYYGLANELGVDAIHRFMTPFGFGARTGIDIDGELPGLQPSSDWKWRRFKQRWYAGDTISVGIGQGYWLATPLQLAAATAVLANDGRVVQPRLVRAIRDSRTREIRELPVRNGPTLALRPEHLALVKAAMVDVMRPGGTAARAAEGAAYQMAGKTGTAQVIGMKAGEKYDEKRVKERHRDHALFIAFAPAEDPKIALAVLAENGGGGSGTAAPIARRVVDYYLAGRRNAGAFVEIAEPAGD